MTSFWDYFSTWSLIITALFLYLFHWFKRPQRFPPGPRGVPLLGVLPILGKHPERVMKKWSKKYGPVMAVRFGPKDAVVLNQFDTIKQVLFQYPLVFILVVCMALWLLELSLVLAQWGVCLGHYSGKTVTRYLN